MNFNWVYLRNVFFLVVLSMAGLFVLTYLHELQHASVYKDFGCSNDIYFVWSGGRTLGLCNTSTVDLSGVNLAQKRVDDLGPLLVGGGSILVTALLFLFFRYREWL